MKNRTLTILGLALFFYLPFIWVSPVEAAGSVSIFHFIADRTLFLAALSMLVLLCVILVFMIFENREKRRLLEALRQNESRQRAIIAGIPDRVWLKDRNGRYLVVNEAWCRFFNRKESEVIGRVASEVFLRELAEKFDREENQVIENRKTFREEQCLTMEGGKQRWFDTFRAPVCGQDGSILGTVGIARDITDRKQTEEALRESEDKYRGIFETSVVGIFQSAPQGRFIAVNQALANTHGFASSEEMIDSVTNIGDQLYVNEEDRRRYLEILRQEGQVRGFEVQQYRKDGSKIWVSLNARAFYGVEGEILYHQGIVEDITQRKLTVEALRESEERFRLLFANSPDGVLMTDLSGMILAANEAACRMFGRTERELCRVGRMAIVDSSDSRVAASIERREKTGITRTEHFYFHKDGTRLLCEVISTLFTDKSGQQRACTIIRDVTEKRRIEEALRESERRLSALVSNLPGVVYRCMNDSNWTMEFISEGCLALTGYSPVDLIGNATLAFNDVICPEDREVVRREIQENLVKRQPYQIAYRIRTSEGLIKWVWEQGSGVYDNTGEVLGLEGFITDMTIQKKAEEELRWKTAFLEAQVASSLDGILVVNRNGKKILQNKRTIDLFAVPKSIVDDSEDEAERRWVADMTRDPEKFSEKVHWLYSHPDEISRDEIELQDGRTLDRYTAPVIGHDGTYYGRIWVFRDISEHKETQKVLEQLSMTDGLTGIANRYRFDDVLEREWRRTMRSHSPLSLILMDIDFFKIFNDNYGHLAGDDCLRRVAQSLTQAARRTSDLVARYGGEEFAFLLPDTAAAGAVAVAQQIRKNMDSLNIPHPHSAVADRVTLSMGLATIIPAKGEASSDLIRLADDLLYKAKVNGRNQVRVSVRD